MKLRPSSGSVGYFLFLDVQAHLAACRLQQRSGGGDFDGLRRLADLELHIKRGPVGQSQSDARLPVFVEARLLDRQHVLAGGQTQNVILAALVGNGGIADHGRLVLCFDLGFWHRKTGRILDRARKLGSAGLSETKQRARNAGRYKE